MTNAISPQNQSASSPRDASLDVFRGILCLTSVLIHVFGAMMALSERGSVAWTLYAAANPILLYAVPGFLVLTCLLSISKLLNPYSLKEYTAKRVTGIVLPYLIWSAFYIALMALKPPPGFSIQDALLKVTYGKSVGHLYYLGVMIQLCVLLVLIAPIFKRKISVAPLLLSTVALTLGCYWLNRLELRLPYVGSVILWYIPAVAAGCWLGTDKSLLKTRLRTAFPWMLLVAATSLFFYLPMAVRVLAKQNVDTFHFQVAEWTYTTTVAVLLIYLSQFIVKGRFGERIAWIGNYSMQIYLAHPLFLNLMIRVFHPKSTLLIPIAGVVYVLACFACPLLLAKGLEKTKLSHVFFGR